MLQQLANSYVCLRRYADAERVLDRAIAVDPKESTLRAFRAAIELEWHADPRPLRSTIEAIVAEDPREAKNIAQLWLRGSLCKRDLDGAPRALGCSADRRMLRRRIPFPRAWCEGVVAQMGGDKAAAQLPLPARELKRPNWLRTNLIIRKDFACSGWLMPPSATKRTQSAKAAARSSFYQ